MLIHKMRLDDNMAVLDVNSGAVHLVDEVTGLPVTYPDGAPVAFSLKELAAIAADRQRTTTEGIAGLYNRLFGEGADGLVR